MLAPFFAGGESLADCLPSRFVQDGEESCREVRAGLVTSITKTESCLIYNPAFLDRGCFGRARLQPFRQATLGRARLQPCRLGQQNPGALAPEGARNRSYKKGTHT
jgi:hypothetical protein